VILARPFDHLIQLDVVVGIVELIVTTEEEACDFTGEGDSFVAQIYEILEF